MELGDLYVLKYSSNNCYARAFNVDDCGDDSLEVDLEKGVWSNGLWENVPVGLHRSPRHLRKGEHDCRGFEPKEGIIGLYDKNNLVHVNSILTDRVEATASQGSMIYD